MVFKNLKNILWNNLTLKFMSLFFGYTFWAMISQTLPVTISLPVPLSFYNVASDIQVNAPETIVITLRGKRAYLNHLDYGAIAFHVDGTTLQEGKNYIPLKAEQLFLPESINLLDYKQSSLVIDMHQQPIQVQEPQKIS